MITELLAMFLAVFVQQAAPAPEYTIEAIRFGTLPQFRTSQLVIGADANERADIPVVVWLIRGGGKTILFDSGYKPTVPQYKSFGTTDYVQPDEAVKLAGVQPGDVTDVIVSHVHWDHMDGIDLFPNATIWIQKAEYEYYTGMAWQTGGRGGAELDDLIYLVRRNIQRKVKLIDGDDKEILPGIRAYTGARHTYASQYIRVAGTPSYVLASDNAYTYRNIDEKKPIATFEQADRPANIASFDRMVQLAGAKERVLPGHDMKVFERFPTQGRVAKIK